MKIRSITLFLDPEWPLNSAAIMQAGQAASLAVQNFESAGYEVQTTRLATTPFPLLFSGLKAEAQIAAIQTLEQTALQAGFSYTAIGPALIDLPESYPLIPEIIANTETIFCSAEIATRKDGLSISAAQACARIINQLAPQDPNGFANLYFTALANVPAGSPFFPAAYHQGGSTRFALATESASLAVNAFQSAETLETGLVNLREAIETHASALTTISENLTGETGIPFSGIDFSLAPFPDAASSLGTAVEAMGIPHIGQHGSLAAAAILAATLDQADLPRVGFSGLLFAQLEDASLAQRAAEGFLTVKDLLMYSAVCGTGLDTIPLPGNTPSEQLTPLLLDLAALALRLDKPLTARLMPIPGKIAGDETKFDFPFFANSRVMPLSAEKLHSPFTADQRIAIPSRPKK
jgi:uncharacterized protein (UPF0210 family)